MPRSPAVALTLITMRVRTEDIEYVKRLAQKSETFYQHILRAWIAEGAERARARGKRGKNGA